MRALVKTEKAVGLTLKDVPTPSCGPNDVQIDVQTTAICGTDLHIYQWDAWAAKTILPPRIIGHEFTGIIAHVGSNVQHLKSGMRVSGEGHFVCNTCRQCTSGKKHLCRNTQGLGIHRDGAFAEQVVVHEDNVVILPDHIGCDEGAILDPLGNAVHTVLSCDIVGEDVLITGAGPIGMMAAAICKHIGARYIVITDISDDRLELAKKMGATHTVNVGKTSLKQAMQEMPLHEGFSVGLEMSGHAKALQQLIDVMAWGGHISLLGLFGTPVPIEWEQVIFKGLTLKGIYGREMFSTWHKMMRMLESGLNVTPVITHRFLPEQFEEAFLVLRSGTAGKVLLQWR